MTLKDHSFRRPPNILVWAQDPVLRAKSSKATSQFLFFFFGFLGSYHESKHHIISLYEFFHVTETGKHSQPGPRGSYFSRSLGFLKVSLGSQITQNNGLLYPPRKGPVTQSCTSPASKLLTLKVLFCTHPFSEHGSLRSRPHRNPSLPRNSRNN